VRANLKRRAAGERASLPERGRVEKRGRKRGRAGGGAGSGFNGLWWRLAWRPAARSAANSETVRGECRDGSGKNRKST